MEIIIPLAAISIFLSILFFRIRKQRLLLKKRENYEKILRDARVTRYKYMQALENTRKILQEVERIGENLATLKAELAGYRRELRSQIESLKHQRNISSNSELDKRTLAQMKNELAERWKFTNGRKKVCCGVRADFQDIQAKFNALEKEEKAITEKWSNEKDTVLRTYRHLKEEVIVTDPMKYFS